MSGHQQTSLLHHYNLNVEQLDYSYVRECSDVATLERIVKVMRSGQEGCYPHFLRFCEDRLRDLHPDNRLIFTPQSPTRLHPKEFAALKVELGDWGEEMRQVEECASLPAIKPPLPPIRTTTVIGLKGCIGGQVNQTQVQDDILAGGWQYVKDGDMLQASLQFQKVLAINPCHAKALKGMETVQVQIGKAQDDPKVDNKKGRLIEELE